MRIYSACKPVVAGMGQFLGVSCTELHAAMELRNIPVSEREYVLNAAGVIDSIIIERIAKKSKVQE